MTAPFIEPPSDWPLYRLCFHLFYSLRRVSSEKVNNLSTGPILILLLSTIRNLSQLTAGSASLMIMKRSNGKVKQVSIIGSGASSIQAVPIMNLKSHFFPVQYTNVGNQILTHEAYPHVIRLRGSV